MKKKYSRPYEYENHIAEIIPRGQRVPGSGAKHGDLDVSSTAGEISPGYRVDCKLTDAASFRVNEKEFQEVEKKAQVGQIPLMFVLLGSGDSYAVIKEEDLAGLMETSEHEGE
jgi:hypothetical protein